MTPVIRRTGAGLALCAALLLSACGNADRGPLPGALQKAFKQLSQRKSAEPPLTLQTLKARLTPELRAQIGRPILLAELPKLKTAALMVEGGRNGAYTSWFAGDGSGVSTRSGLLSASRGIGADLMSADIAGPLAVITGRSKAQSATRVHRYLDGENAEITQHFTCSYRRAASTVTETCDTLAGAENERADLTIENQYWLTKKGQIWRSVQWISPRNGYIVLETP